MIHCDYFKTESGRCPVREFIDSLELKSQRKFFFVKSLLEEFSYKLPQPHAKYLGDGIFELRFSAKEGAVRILYFFFHQSRAILTNGFLKKMNKTPEREKTLAVERKKIFIDRA